MSESKRKFFRIFYPNNDCPRLLLSGMSFNVIDVSEEGVRFIVKSVTGFTVGQSASGSVTFADGESFLIHGSVARVTDSDVSLNLKRAIPLRKIMAEQRRLIEKYPKVSNG